MTNEAKEQEIWKQYPDYNFIEVSNLGRVRTKDRTVIRSNGRKCFVKGRILKQHDNGRGYMRASFSLNGKQIDLYVHRAVAICFIPNPNNYLEVNHKDNDKKNNIVSNLEWCSPGYNIAYREKYGTSAKEATRVLRHPVIAINQETSKVFWFESQHEAARQLNINQRDVSNVLKGGRCKTAHGFWFTDADKNAVEKTRNKFGDEIAEKVRKLMNNIKTM